MEKQARKLFRNAMLLTAASLLVRTVSVGFQVAVSNVAGAEAMGLYALMAGVYGFALTLATSGIHLSVTRVVVDAVGRGEAERVRTVMQRASLYALCFGGASMILLTAGAGWIGNVWLKDARTVAPLRLFGASLPLISLSSAWGGYFTAVRRVGKNAAVQVLEQFLRVGFTMSLLSLFCQGDVEKTLCAMVLGGTLAQIGSFLPQLVLYLSDRVRHFPHGSGDGRTEGRKLLGITIPVAVTTYLRSGLITLEHVLIPEGLRNSGSSHEKALVAYGSIHSMALPVILYPAALIASFSGLLIPELTESAVQNANRRIRYIVSRVWSLSLIFSIGTAGLLICFSGELGNLLYPGTEAGYYIRVLAPLVPVMYVDTATDAMMKGLGEQVYSMKVNVADAALSVILVWILVPLFGIRGYVATVYLSELFNTVLSVTHLLSVSKTPVRVVKWVYKPLAAIVGATCAVRIAIRLFGSRLPGGIHALLLCGTAVIAIYLLLLVATGSIDRDDRGWIKEVIGKSEE